MHFGWFLMDFGRFLMDFWMIFQWFLIEFWLIFDVSTAAPTARHSAREHQKSIKNHWKIIQKSTKIHQKSIKNLLKSVLGPQEAPRPPQDPPSPKTGSTFATPPGTILEGFWSHVGPKSHLKASQKTYKIFIDLEVHLSSIFHRFWEAFGGFWEPCWLPRCTIN